MTIDTEKYTVANDANNVKASEFRELIDYLLRIIRIDSMACVTREEKAANVELAKRIGSELISTICKRASDKDWRRRECAIEDSFSYIENEG